MLDGPHLPHPKSKTPSAQSCGALGCERARKDPLRLAKCRALGRSQAVHASSAEGAHPQHGVLTRMRVAVVALALTPCEHRLRTPLKRPCRYSAEAASAQAWARRAKPSDSAAISSGL